MSREGTDKFFSIHQRGWKGGDGMAKQKLDDKYQVLLTRNISTNY